MSEAERLERGGGPGYRMLDWLYLVFIGFWPTETSGEFWDMEVDHQVSRPHDDLW